MLLLAFLLLLGSWCCWCPFSHGVLLFLLSLNFVFDILIWLTSLLVLELNASFRVPMMLRSCCFWHLLCMILALASPLFWRHASICFSAVARVLLLLTSQCYHWCWCLFRCWHPWSDWCSFFFCILAVVLHSAVPPPFLMPALQRQNPENLK